MSKVIAIQPTKDFKARSKAVLDDPGQRKNFRGAMDFLQAKRRAQFGDQEELQSLRDLGAAIRRYSLAHLPRLLQQLEAKLTANGIQVHWAENADEANAIALAIAQRVKAKRIIKGKSMVSEEVGFNHATWASTSCNSQVKRRHTSSCRPFTRPSRRLQRCLPKRFQV